MVVFSKQITLLIHIIIHTTKRYNKKNYFSHHTLEIYSPLWCWEKNSVSENMYKNYSSLTKPPPPPPWKSNGRSLRSSTQNMSMLEKFNFVST